MKFWYAFYISWIETEVYYAIDSSTFMQSYNPLADIIPQIPGV